MFAGCVTFNLALNVYICLLLLLHVLLLFVCFCSFLVFVFLYGFCVAHICVLVLALQLTIVLLSYTVNPLSPKLNPICYLLALLAHHFLHVSRIRVKSLTLR